jgi:hypothetical protein
MRLGLHDDEDLEHGLMVYDALHTLNPEQWFIPVLIQQHVLSIQSIIRLTKNVR